MTTIRALREDEFDAHAELVYVSYSHERKLTPGEMLAQRDWWLRSIERDPYYEPEQTRVLEVGGRLVAGVTCYYRPSYIAGQIIDAACIGSVCTHPDFRRRGYVRALLSESVAWMSARGWEWSWLYGREEVYGGSGWTNLTGYDLTADLRLRADFTPELTERVADPEDEADVALLGRLYAALNARLTGPTVRNEEYWRRRVLAPRPWAPGPQYRLVFAGEQPVGYYHREDAAVREIAWTERPHEVLAQVLRAVEAPPVSFPCALPELLTALRDLAEIPGQAECFAAPRALTLREAYKGLWRRNDLADPRLPEVTNTASLVRFLHDRDYVMWPADRT